MVGGEVNDCGLCAGLNKGKDIEMLEQALFHAKENIRMVIYCCILLQHFCNLYSLTLVHTFKITILVRDFFLIFIFQFIFWVGANI